MSHPATRSPAAARARASSPVPHPRSRTRSPARACRLTAADRLARRPASGPSGAYFAAQLAALASKRRRTSPAWPSGSAGDSRPSRPSRLAVDTRSAVRCRDPVRGPEGRAHANLVHGRTGKDIGAEPRIGDRHKASSRVGPEQLIAVLGEHIGHRARSVLSTRCDIAFHSSWISPMRRSDSARVQPCSTSISKPSTSTFMPATCRPPISESIVTSLASTGPSRIQVITRVPARSEPGGAAAGAGGGLDRRHLVTVERDVLQQQPEGVGRRLKGDDLGTALRRPDRVCAHVGPDVDEEHRRRATPAARPASRRSGGLAYMTFEAPVRCRSTQIRERSPSLAIARRRSSRARN